jgi:hypothetical protein
VNGVVHTLGTLLEGGKYKKAIAEHNLGAVVESFVSGLVDSGNPLEKEQRESYNVLNRDSGMCFSSHRDSITHTSSITALRVCETFLSSSPSVQSLDSRPFVFVSAEDIFRPLISARYIETKREAEQGIEQMMLEKTDYRGVYIRPST